MTAKSEKLGTRTEGDEKLRVVGVFGTIVRAGDKTAVREPQPWVYLVFEGFCGGGARVNAAENSVNNMKRTSVD